MVVAGNPHPLIDLPRNFTLHGRSALFDITGRTNIYLVSKLLIFLDSISTFAKVQGTRSIKKLILELMPADKKRPWSYRGVGRGTRDIFAVCNFLASLLGDQSFFIKIGCKCNLVVTSQPRGTSLFRQCSFQEPFCLSNKRLSCMSAREPKNTINMVHLGSYTPSSPSLTCRRCEPNLFELTRSKRWTSIKMHEHEMHSLPLQDVATTPLQRFCSPAWHNEPLCRFVLELIGTFYSGHTPK